MTNAFFIAGTDTGVGKTLAAVSLLDVARAAGLTTLGLKPVAAGCELTDGLWMNEDAQQLMLASNTEPSYPTVNPAALREAMAPHIAANRENIKLEAAELADHCRSATESADFCVIEGAGGWDVPLNETESMADLARLLGYPVILVVGLRLGCINHSLLTSAAIEHSGLRLAGWIANHLDPDMIVVEENIQTLEDRLPAPLLGRIPYLDNKADAGSYLRLPEAAGHE